MKLHNGKRLISAKGISAKTGISYQTVNSYTDLGLFDVVTKKNRQRMYDYTQIMNRMSKIKRLIEEGYTLRLISKQLSRGGVKNP